MGGSSNLPRLVSYAENPEIVTRLEEYCRQHRCSKSQAISRLLEQALGLSGCAMPALPSTAIAQKGIENSAASASKIEALEKENNLLKRENDNLKGIVKEMESPSSVSTVCATIAETASASDGTASASNGTSYASELDKKLEPIESKLSKLHEQIINGFKESNQQQQELADYLKEKIEAEENTEEIETEIVDENTEKIDELQEKFKSERARADKYHELWYSLFPRQLQCKDVKYPDLDDKTQGGWVRTALPVMELYRLFGIPTISI